MKTNLNLKNQQLPLFLLKTKLDLNTKILTLPLNELKEFYTLKAEENPFLEELDSAIEKDLGRALGVKKNEIFKDEESQEKYLKDIHIENASSYYQTNITSFKDPQSVMEATLKDENSFLDELHKQLAFFYQEDSLEYKIGIYLIDLMDERGFITQDKFKLVETKMGDKAGEVWEKIKTFTPLGIGASDLRECLLLQIKKDQEYEIENSILENHFELFLKRDFKALAKKMGLPSVAIEKAFEKISFLEFYPKRSEHNETAYIYPDARIIERDKKLFLIVNDQEIPRFFYNKNYLSDIKKNKTNNSSTKSNLQFKEFIKEKRQEAENLLFALKYRNLNLIKIMSYILSVQKYFFYKGRKNLLPDTLTNAAKILNIDISTLSRVVNQKYVDTKWGILSLKYFFSSKEIKGNGGAVSSEKIKTVMEEIIANSDVKLSDQKLMEILNKKGFSISRRTVNKYRNKMKILPSFKRN